MSRHGWLLTFWLAGSACGRTEVFSATDLDRAGTGDEGRALDAGVDMEDAGATGDGGAAQDDAGAPFDAGPPSFERGAATTCPHVTWTGPLPIRYAGDTSGLQNWVSSLTAAWREGPDDSFLFTVPIAGRYKFFVDSGVPDLGFTFRDRNGALHAARGCPDGGFFMLDQADIVLRGEELATFDAGTQVLIWISVPAWRPTMPAGPYELSITRQ